MNNENLKPIEKLTPFTKMIMTIGTLPSSFYASMSYYESMCWLYEYLKNQVIPTVNNNAEAVEELQQKFIELEQWVHEYEETQLPIEVVNKLNEMATDGTLQTILDEVMKYKGLLTFDNVEDLKNSTNIVNGGFAQTLGYYNINDGGKALYKITNEESENEYQEELSNDLYATLILDNKIIPEQFGCYGDGIHDDSTNLRKALKYSIDNKKILLINKKYYIKESLLTDEDYDTAEVNIQGHSTLDENYTVGNNGGILFNSGINLFENITIKGKISNTCFAPTSRTQTGSIFKNCQLTGLIFNGNYVCNILAFMHNSTAGNITKITNNLMKTVYYFGKSDENRHNFVDSEISNNYINGGAEMNNNNCFEFLDWNGSTVHDNFIDYYRTIYEPRSTTLLGSSLPNSINNEYQVFRYLYYIDPTEISYLSFNSIGDIFNWTAPSSLSKLQSYTKHQYTNTAQGGSTVLDIPESIGIVASNYYVKILDAKLESNLGNIVSILNFSQSSKNGVFKMTDLSQMYNTNSYYKNDYFYNAGNYKSNIIDIPYKKTLETLPTLNAGWGPYYAGERIIVDNIVYRMVWNNSNSQYEWIQDYSI